MASLSPQSLRSKPANRMVDTVPAIRDIKIEVSIDDLLRVHGTTEAQVRREALDNYRRLLDEALPLLQPAYIYRDVPVAETGEGFLVLETGHVLKAAILAKLLRTAKTVYFMCCTIGPLLEKRVREYKNDGSPAKAYILDSIGSLATDLLAQDGCGFVDSIAEKAGLATSIPLSPGYLGWSLRDQQVFFQLLDPAEIGVVLTETFIMSPLKSTTQAIGLVAESGGKAGKTNCDYCSLKSRCKFRKAQSA
jgi:hypothetical protein